jgi:hypothetical protein
MKKVFVISAAAFIAIGAAVSSSIKANAEDNEGGGVARVIRPAPVAPSAAPPEKAYYYRPYYHRPFYRRHYYRRRYY